MKAKTPIVLAVMLLALWKAPAEDAFDKPGIVKIAIETQTASRSIPDRSPGTWLAAKVLEGDKVFTGATVYFRGHGTEGKLDKSPNLTIKFDSTDPAKQFHGHQTILLDNAVLDRTYVSDVIASDFFRSAGVPAPHVTYASVTFNGAKLGLYVMVEGIDHAFLEHHFKNHSGNLYYGERPTTEDALVKEQGEPLKDRADLDALLSAAQYKDLAKRMERLKTVLDMDRFISCLAADVLLNRSSGYTLRKSHYRIYHDPKSDRMVFIPTRYGSVAGNPYAPVIPEMVGLISKAVLETPEGKQLYQERLKTLANNSLKLQSITARVDELTKMVQPALTDYDKTMAAEQKRGADFLLQRIGSRITTVQEALAHMETQEKAKKVATANATVPTK